jgi:hypothetical protein
MWCDFELSLMNRRCHSNQNGTERKGNGMRADGFVQFVKCKDSYVRICLYAGAVLIYAAVS